MSRKIQWYHFIIEIAKSLGGTVRFKDDDFKKTIYEVKKELPFDTKSKNIMGDVCIHFADNSSDTSELRGIDVFKNINKGEWKLRDQYMDMPTEDIIKTAKDLQGKGERSTASNKKDTNKADIPRPTVKEVKQSLDQWNKAPEMKSYREQEKVLNDIFNKYPKNSDFEKVLLKVLTLDKFYSTQLKNVLATVNGILKIKYIDSRLSRGDKTLVKDITIADDKINNYSFATKYCSHHKPDIYYIYDNYVRESLRYFDEKDKFLDKNNQKHCIKNNEHLRDYDFLKSTIEKFIKHYELTEFSIKEIDKYLWQLGKKYSSTKKVKK